MEEGVGFAAAVDRGGAEPVEPRPGDAEPVGAEPMGAGPVGAGPVGVDPFAVRKGAQLRSSAALAFCSTFACSLNVLEVDRSAVRSVSDFADDPDPELRDPLLRDEVPLVAADVVEAAADPPADPLEPRWVPVDVAEASDLPVDALLVAAAGPGLDSADDVVLLVVPCWALANCA